MIRQLEQIYEDERRFLLAGNLDPLVRLAARKEELGNALGKSALPPETLARLAALGERNSSLLAAAGDGLRSAQVRIGEIQRGAPVETYSRSGEKSEYARPVRTLQRRA